MCPNMRMMEKPPLKFNFTDFNMVYNKIQNKINNMKTGKDPTDINGLLAERLDEKWMRVEQMAERYKKQSRQTVTVADSRKGVSYA